MAMQWTSIILAMEFNYGIRHNIEVDQNIVQGVRDGIYLEFSDNITINNN